VKVPQQPTAQEVKALRDRTGAGMMDCKAALVEAGGDIEQAVDILRAKGAADAAKRAGREANEGYIDAYVHMGRVGAMVEVNCETDFVSRGEDLRAFAHDVALHVASLSPLYLSVDDVPEDFKERERAIFTEESKDVDERFRERAVDGKLAKRLKEITLLEQEFVRDQGEKKPRTIEQLRQEVAARVGENVTIRRFVRYELGR
jgi:elongation factor Ts